MPRELLKILLVEDNAGDARLIQELLKEVRTFVADVDLAQSVAEASARLREKNFDIVLLDLTLPDGAGSATVAKLHAATTDVPIVVLTGIDDENVALDAMTAGAEDYLVKGNVDGALLARALRYAIQRKRAEDNVRRLVREQAARAQAETAARRARFLSELGRSLASTLDWDATMQAAAHAVVPELADVSAIDVIDDGGEAQRLAVAAAHAEDAALAGVVPRAGQEHDPAKRMDLPLTARGRALGTLTLMHTRSGRRFDEADRAYASEVASRIALAVDNAKLVRAREDMLSVVSHDLRNPLNVIGFVTASLRRPTLTEEQRKSYVDKLRRAADRMNRLIQDLLDVSRMEHGTLPLDRVPLPATLVVAEVLEMMRPLTDEKKIALTADVADSLPSVSIDRERVLQVFGNVVGNAVKFTPESGAITIAARVAGDEVHFEVTDTGPGIATENLARIFDRFWQAKRKDRQGAGLGLAIAKGLVFAHQGRIWAESVPGRGATFHIALPIARPESGVIVDGASSITASAGAA